MAVNKRAPLALSLDVTRAQKEPLLNLKVNGCTACCLHTTDTLIADRSSCAEFLLVLTAHQMPHVGAVHMGPTRPIAPSAHSDSYSLFRWALDSIRLSLQSHQSRFFFPFVMDRNPFPCLGVNVFVPAWFKATRTTDSDGSHYPNKICVYDPQACFCLNWQSVL